MLFSKFSLLPVLLGALNANGYFLQGIPPIGNKRQDPIVDTGMMFGNHSHAIMGSSNFNSVVTSDILRSASCTSVPILEDHSNYWVPTVLFQWANSSFTELNVGFVLYYLFDNTNPNVTAFPDNFRMISGTHTKRTYDPADFAQRAVTFLCLDFNGVSVTYNHFPTKPCPSGVRAQLNFPSCWDGVNLDSPDHKSHVSFPSEGPDSGTCNDPKFPVTLPRLFLESYWDTTPFNDIWDEAMSPSQPFMTSSGDRTGYGHHGDFFNGWEKGILQNVIDQCDCTIAGFGDPTCCGQKGVVTYRTDVPECTLASPSTEQVTGTLDQLPGGNIPSGLIPSLNGEIYANGTWELAVPLSQQPPPVILPGVGNAVVSPSGVAASNSVFASSVKTTSTLMSSAMAISTVASSAKVISTASSTKIVNTASSVKTPASSVKSTNTPVSKPTSSVHSSSIAQPSSAPASGSNDNGNNNGNGDIWPTAASSSGTSSLSSESASPSPSPSSSNHAGSSSNNSNGGSSSSGGNPAPAQNSPLATSSLDSSGSGVTQVAQASATPTSSGTSSSSSSGSSSDNGGAGSSSSSSQGSDVNSGSSSSSSGGNEDSSSSSSSTQDSNAGASSSAASSAGSGSASSSSSNSGSDSSPNSGSGSDSPGNNVPASSQQQPSNSGNATSGTAKNSDKCRNRHASSLEARAAEAAPVPIKHAAISSHHYRSRAFNRLRSTGDMLA